MTAGTRVALPDGEVVKARELSGRDGLLFRRNSRDRRGRGAAAHRAVGRPQRRAARQRLSRAAREVSSVRSSSSLTSPRRPGTRPAGEVDVQRLVDVDRRARRRRAATVTGESPPRRTCATAAPLAPVPADSVSPTPRSKIRARMRVGRDLAPERLTLVRLGKIAACSIGGPDRCEVERVELVALATRIAHCGLPIVTCWKRHVAPVGLELAVPVRRPAGKSPSAAARGPCRRVQVRRSRDRRADLARDGLDRERVRVGPAARGAGRGSPRARRCPTARPRSRPG